MKNILLTQKNLFMLMMIFSLNMSITSDSMMGIWMSMEINLFTIIPMLNMNNKKNTEKSIMIYFLIQGVSSAIFLFSTMKMLKISSFKFLYIYLIYMSLMMKLGMFPFYIWILTILENLSWKLCFILITIQKIIPFMTFLMIMQSNFILIMSILNSTIASLSGLKTFSLRKIISYSSMNHLSFMLISIILSKKMFKIYFLFYSMLNFFLMKLMEKLNMNFIFQIMNFKKMNKSNMMNFLFLILSIAGIPPFLGFFPKTMLLLKMTQMKLFIPILLILILNSLTMFFYIRLTLSSMFLNKNQLKTVNKKMETQKNYFYIIILFPIMYIMWNFKLKQTTNFQN